MEGLLLVTTLLLCIIVLFLGLVFCFVVSRMFGIDLTLLPSQKKDNLTPTDKFDGEDERVALDQFVPQKDKPLKVVFKK